MRPRKVLTNAFVPVLSFVLCVVMAGIQNIPTVGPKICLAEVKILELKLDRTKENKKEGGAGFCTKYEACIFQV